METVELDGEWTLRRKSGGKRAPAVVPGCVHTDLLDAGLIPDPYYRDNEKAVQWVQEEDWIYSRPFDVPDRILGHDRLLLVCEGLDTLATIFINGHAVGRADNMFRTWEFDVKNALKRGKNRIDAHFDSPAVYVRRKTAELKRNSPASGTRFRTGAALRKEPCSFGWDWGPVLTSSGIWRSIRIAGFTGARIKDILIRQQHRRGKVLLTLDIAVEKTAPGRLGAVVTVSRSGKTAAETASSFAGAGTTVSLTVADPELWWPNGMGEQPLYEATVDLIDSEGGLLDTQTKRIGLRELALERKRDRRGETFGFKINGIPFFAKGANWIPADAFVTRVTSDRYAALLGDAAAANMNMIRVWGGGIYENDVMYDLCDELGLCVWQDFMFACSPYPAFDKSFMQNVEAEARDNIRRIRHHACIALWCGNNELEQAPLDSKWTARNMSLRDYSRLFDMKLPDLVRKLDPDRRYWPSSPHSPLGDRTDHSSPSCGDAHLWQVWHGGKPFEWYRTSRHRFCSEFGFQSFPEPETVRRFTCDSDRNITSPVMEHHQRSGQGNSKIINYMLEWFRMPRDFEMTLWLSQVLQSVAMKYAVEHWRRIMPQCKGALYWQLNDCWPAASWSSLDSLGRWKALHYVARRFYAPVLAFGMENSRTGIVEMCVCNDRPAEFRGNLTWILTDPEGRVLAEDTVKSDVAAGKSRRIEKVDFSDVIDRTGTNSVIVWMTLNEGARTVSSNMVLFAKPKAMELRDPGLKCAVTRNVSGGDWDFNIGISARRPALWAWAELRGLDARFSDNFFHIRPGCPCDIGISVSSHVSVSEIRKRLRVRSLYDTYSH